MPVVMGPNRYGKDGIRLVLVRREAAGSVLRDLTVDVRLEGSFDRVHTEGDNSTVLPTDTMRSTVYAMAQSHLTGPVEDFASALGQRFLSASPAASVAVVSIREHGWTKVAVTGDARPQAFVGGSAECVTAVVTSRRDGLSSVRSGITGLTLLKTTGSAFAGFLRDEFTVLPETRDRILATDVTADWSYVAGAAPAYDDVRSVARSALIECFARHESESVQHTLHAIGSALVEACPDIEEVSMRMPNKHHVPVDLSPFGITNDRAVFVATDRPFGVIEGTVRRT